MSRILFAAARGARIQEYSAYLDSWVAADFLPNLPDLTDECRIHPEDEHLQYGPISSALRAAAEAGNRWDLTGWHGRMAEAAATYQAAWWYASEPVRTLFLLILAEALADEGL